ncbi:hypothetical protein [Frigidibacter sp. MR17.24]|uniref:hypothetical protein n=1 Tax=Frigidibacter sp. MR17.24 TaxID=3127345 RepID=UPI0030129D48
MPERKKLRLDIVRFLVARGARSAEGSVDAMDHFLGLGIRSRDYAEAITDLLSLRVIAHGNQGEYVTEEGEEFAGPELMRPRKAAD